MTQWAPVALFIYRRPEHVRRTILSLQACDGFESSPIYVFADGPRTESDLPEVREARAFARELLGPRAVFVEQEKNRGLANSIIAGTTELCDRHGSAIVVEDDLVLAPGFLRFLNGGLERYRDEPRVMQVSGHMFDVPSLHQEHQALFLPMTTSWGWATWKRAWDLFDPAATGWRDRLADSGDRKRFNLDGRYDYYRMLERQMDGRLDSWAIRWHYTVFVRDGLTLFPPQTLVSNGGFDGSGTHGRLARPVHQAPLQAHMSFRLPSEVERSRHTADVYRSIAALRQASARQRLTGLTTAVLGRLASIRG